ncbi:hypothetical protein PG993_004371 [Apiospora rasikravindrae]|uniref:Ecp2 effector protein domain-containing protein n=1 Tax=Apiospora rasikravindrae TaxID=990691 RepID=A0ABR1TD63_9PEZI
MLFKSALVTIAVAASSVAAFIVPTDLADGVYIFNGTVGPTRIGDAAEAQRFMAARDGVFPGDSRMQCDGVTIDKADMDRATESLRQMCSFNRNIEGGNHLGIAVGSAVAYACSYGGIQPCHLNEVNDYVMWSDKDCGAYRGSFLHIPKWDKAYGRAPRDIDICPQ